MAAINIGFIIVTQRYFGRGSEGKSLKRGEGGKTATKGRFWSRWREENAKTMEKGPLGKDGDGATVGAKPEGRQGSEAKVKEAGRGGREGRRGEDGQVETARVEVFS